MAMSYGSDKALLIGMRNHLSATCGVALDGPEGSAR